MLRPSKIFVSLHQLRHYFNSRISELAVSHQPTQLALQLKHGPTTTTATQQMMALFSHFQKTAVKVPVQTISNEKYLLQKIHQHFPVTKSLSSPVLQQRVWAMQQPRLGFCRPTTALGLGSTARHYSSTPFAPVFQHNAPTQSAFAHMSSRFFTPAATKCSSNQQQQQQQQVDNDMKPTLKQAVRNTPCSPKEIYGAKVFVPEPVLSPMVAPVDNNNNNSISELDSSIIRHDDDSHYKSILGSSSLNAPTSTSQVARSVYLLIPMDATQFWTTTNMSSKHSGWSTERLCSTFVDSIEQMAYEYQVHIDSVLKLLDRLDRCGTFRTVSSPHELRVYFPPSVQSKEEAMLVLETFRIVMNACFSIQVEVEHGQDKVVSSSDEPSSSIGPDYFRDLQSFLDHTDYLIETNPFFNQR